jgi:hypothetical protein
LYKKSIKKIALFSLPFQMAEMSSVGGVQIVPGTTQFAGTHTFKNLGGWYRLGIL